MSAQCELKHQIITPDGEVFPLNGPSWSVGTDEQRWPLEGVGLPDVEHISQELYGVPGDVLKDMKVLPRIVTITSTLGGIDRMHLHSLRSRMWQMSRWDRGEKGEPSILRSIVSPTEHYDLYVYYAGAVERFVDRLGRSEVVGLRLQAHDPFFYEAEDDEHEQVLDGIASIGVTCRIASKVDGVWGRMGPPVGCNLWPKNMLYDEDSGYLFITGEFVNWDNQANADYMARWDGTAWSPCGDNGAGGPALNLQAFGMRKGPDGWIWVVGAFTNAGGVGPNYLARYNPYTDAWDYTPAPNQAGGVINAVRDLEIADNGDIYIIGDFTNWNGAANSDYICFYDVSGAAWTSMGTGLSSRGNRLAKAPDGTIYAGGNFVTANGVAVNCIAYWNGTTFVALDGGMGPAIPEVWAMRFGLDGTLYAGGSFTQAGSAPTTVNYIAAWNGAIWRDLDGGADSQVYEIWVDFDGSIYACGVFTTIGSLVVDNAVAMWNGYSWSHVGVDLGGGINTYSLTVHNGDIYLGFDFSSAMDAAAPNSVVVDGNAPVYPLIEIKNSGRLDLIENWTTGEAILFDLAIQEGEIITIDLTPGAKSVESNWRGNLLGRTLPNSDLATFRLESYPRANYGGVEGANLVSVFICDGWPKEYNDGGNQLSNWQNITGISQANTNLGRVYVEIVADGGGFYHVDIYQDPAMGAGDLVGHTATYNGVGAKAIVADNASGLGGTITVDNVVGADADIEVVYTIVTMFWRNRYWDLDSAVSG